MTETCTLTISRTSAGYVFRVHGRGTMRESAAVRRFVRGALEQGTQVVLDLTSCEYLDSTFCGCLLVLHQAAQATSGTLLVFANSATRKRLLHALRIDRVLAFADELPEVMGEPVNLQVSEIAQPEFCEHIMETHRQLADLGGPAAEVFLAIADQLTEELKRS